MATGGTGGHIYPATATAKELITRGYQALLLGQRGGMEERVAAEQGIAFEGVDAGKLARSGQGMADPRQLLKAGAGIVQARKILSARKPAAVVGYGGFASLPGVLAAQSLGIPTLLHEQNAVLGLTQKLAVSRAQAVGTAYSEVRGLDPRKATLVGMPVREERLPRAGALARLGLEGKGLDDTPLTLLLMGGSQGSLFLNETVPGVLRQLFGPEGVWRAGQLPSVQSALGVPLLDFNFTGRSRRVQVLHATGRRWLEQVAPTVTDLPWYRAVDYVDAVAAWSAADLAITRAGTSTLAEAAFHGVPLIMVPLPESAENHQYHNGLNVQRVGAGQVVEQGKAAQELGRAVLECAEPETLAAMREAALSRAQPGAAARFADLIQRALSSSAPPTSENPS